MHDDYCMAECASRQDEVSKSGVQNIGHLSGQDGCVLPSLGFPCLSSKKKLSFWLIINPHFAKLVRSRWLDIGIALFCLYY